MKHTTAFFPVFFLACAANAQNGIPCATDFLHQQALQDPVYFQKHNALEAAERMAEFLPKVTTSALSKKPIIALPIRLSEICKTFSTT